MDHSVIQCHMRHAYRAAGLLSDDDNTQVGAIVPDAWTLPLVGANRFSSPGQNIPDNLERSRKYPRIVHAEMDIIFTAAASEISLQGATMVSPWSPCPPCAQGIVRSGISRVYIHKAAMDKTPERWRDLLEIGHEILEDGGVTLIMWEGKVGECKNLFNGEMWEP